MRKLRLLLWEDCDRGCLGCCNKDWDLSALPVCSDDDLARQDIVMLTGGEPLLYPARVHNVIRKIRKVSQAEIYVYTAKVNDFPAAIDVLMAADGMCVTLHDDRDVPPFKVFAEVVHELDRSLRVNVFDGVKLDAIPSGWEAKLGVEWLPNCPLPEGEVFMRL